jgi:hypothetical protein
MVNYMSICGVISCQLYYIMLILWAAMSSWYIMSIADGGVEQQKAHGTIIS